MATKPTTTKAATTTEVAWLTGAAKDDLGVNAAYTTQVAGGGTVNTTNVNVLWNDPGSASLYGIYATMGTEYVNASTKTALAAAYDVTNSYGSFHLSGPGGAITFAANPATVTPAMIQALAAGETMSVGKFWYVIWMGNLGAYSLAQAEYVIRGVNDTATINGGPGVGAMAEDGASQSASGTMSVSDVDHNEAHFQVPTAASLAGTYGAFTFNDGAWAYTLANGADGVASAVQSLRASDTVTDTLTVTSLDGTDTETITITITGKNDAASISGTATGSVSEDGTLSDGNTLAVADIDNGENVFAAYTGATQGTYGSFTFTNGVWTYALDNGTDGVASAVQSMGGGATATDQITVDSSDGTAHETIKVTITGKNDAASISGIAIGSVAEDGTLTDGNTLAVVDIDTGENVFAAYTGATLGTYGSFTFAAGVWTYALDNGTDGTASAVQSLAGGATATDQITVMSSDGTAPQVIQVTVTGKNDAATFGGTAVGDVTENSDPTEAGTLTVSDIDTGEGHFDHTGSLTGAHGTFTFDLSNGGWTYTLTDNSLGTGDSASDSLKVFSADGSSTDIVMTIHGYTTPVVTPPPPPPPPPPPSTAQDIGPVTSGNQNINNRDIAGFNSSDDTLLYANNLTYVGYTLSTGGADPVDVQFSFKGTTFEVTLIGYTGSFTNDNVESVNYNGSGS